MRSFHFFSSPDPFSLTMALESTQPLTEMSTGNLRRVKCGRHLWWQSHRPLWADCLENVGASKYQDPVGRHGVILALHYLYIFSIPLYCIISWSHESASVIHEYWETGYLSITKNWKASFSFKKEDSAWTTIDLSAEYRKVKNKTCLRVIILIN
jgi:hypothetical protein